MNDPEKIQWEIPPDPEGVEEEKEENLTLKIAKIIVALVVLVGLLNIFGFRNLFLYRITSPNVEQVEVVVKTDAEILQVPLNIIVLSTEGGGFGSRRDERSVLSLVKNADEIWDQAGIELVIKAIYFERITDVVLSQLYQNPRLVINNVENFDQSSINIFLVGSLGGINGVSFGGLPLVAVADYTTVYDFRALAHEIGHQLGLTHVSESSGQLMYRGANGFNLSIKEIEIARNFAQTY